MYYNSSQEKKLRRRSPLAQAILDAKAHAFTPQALNRSPRLWARILNPTPKPLKHEMLVVLCRRMTAKLSPADKARAEIPSDSGLISVGLSERTGHLTTSWDSSKIPFQGFFTLADPLEVLSESALVIYRRFSKAFLVCSRHLKLLQGLKSV